MVLRYGRLFPHKIDLDLAVDHGYLKQNLNVKKVGRSPHRIVFNFKSLAIKHAAT
jgi:hypothetical protein